MFKRRQPLPLMARVRQFLWPREGWVRAFRYMWGRAVHSRGSAYSIAMGMAAGAYVSASPFFGAHIAYAWLLCWIFRGNLLAAALGTWVGNPFTFLFIGRASYLTGVWILTALGIGGIEGQSGASALTLNLTFEEPSLTLTLFFEDPLLTLSIFWEKSKVWLIPWIVGSVPVGIVLGIVTYYPSLWTIRVYQIQRQKRAVKSQKRAAKKEQAS